MTRPKAALVGALLRQAHHNVREQVLAHLRQAGYDDIGPSHLVVFQHPPPDGKRPIELAAELGISKQALNYLLGQLEARGYLARPGHADARIRLTPRGWALSESARAAVKHVESQWSKRLGPERYELFRESLAEVALSKTS